MPSLEATLAAIRGRVAAAPTTTIGSRCCPWKGRWPWWSCTTKVIDNILGKRNPEEFLMYTRDAAQAVRWVDEGAGSGAFFLDTPT